ncbi:hypothetical protein EMIT0111MI5_170055 [Burkholderia sp. IT-111MI5]
MQATADRDRGREDGPAHTPSRRARSDDREQASGAELRGIVELHLRALIAEARRNAGRAQNPDR